MPTMHACAASTPACRSKSAVGTAGTSTPPPYSVRAGPGGARRKYMCCPLPTSPCAMPTAHTAVLTSAGVHVLGVADCVASRLPHARLPPSHMLAAADGAARSAIQRLVTAAWKEDRFDPEGARQQDYSLVGRAGRSAWLSPVEVLVRTHASNPRSRQTPARDGQTLARAPTAYTRDS